MPEVEINQIDRCFENIRLKDKSREKILLSSIAGQGVRDPLKCVVKQGGQLILLDGFKRLRCCHVLGIGMVPVESLGDDETAAILQLIRLSNAQSLNFLEQAAMIDELKEKYNLSNGEIALHLERSPAWVSIRSGMIDEMSPVIKEAIFSGSFPVRSYMYTLRPFTRVNGFKKSELDVFVKSVSGKRLSTRDIETLAYGYFRGGRKFKEQIAGGNIDWTLKQMRQNKICPSGGENTFSDSERDVLTNLELVQKYMERVIAGIRESGLNSPSFMATAHLVVEGILSRMDIFKKTMQEFYDQRK